METLSHLAAVFYGVGVMFALFALSCALGYATPQVLGALAFIALAGVFALAGAVADRWHD